MMTVTELFSLFSDTYKNVSGFRPSGEISAHFLSQTGAEQRERCVELQNEIDLVLREEEEERCADSRPWGEIFGDLIGVGPEDRAW